MLKLGDLAVAGVLALGLKAYLDRMPTPPPAPPTPGNGGMFGFGNITGTPQERRDKLATALFGGTTYTEAMKPWKGKNKYQEWLDAGGDPSQAVSQIVPPRLTDLGTGFKQRVFTGPIALTAEQVAEIGGPSKLSITRPKGLD